MGRRKPEANGSGPGLVSEQEILKLAEAWMRGTGEQSVPQEALELLIDDLTEARLVVALYDQVLEGTMFVGGIDEDGQAVFCNDPPTDPRGKRRW